MIFVFALFLLTLLVITALAIVHTENLFVAVMLTSISGTTGPAAWAVLESSINNPVSEVDESIFFIFKCLLVKVSVDGVSMAQSQG